MEKIVFSGLVMRLPLGDLANQSLAALGKSDDGGRGPRTLFIWNNFGLPALQNGDHRVGGSEVDPDNLCHCWLLNSKEY